MKNKNLRFFIFMFIGILTFYWVFKTFSGKDSLNYINDNLEMMALLFIAHIPTLFMDSLSWRILMSNNKLNLRWCIIITWIAQTASKIMPTGVLTGEFVRIYLGKKRGIPVPQISATVIGDLILATCSLMIMGIISIIIFINYYKEPGQDIIDLKLMFLASSLIILGSVFFCISMRYRLIKSLLRMIISKKVMLPFKHFTFNLLKTDYVLYQLSFQLNRLFLGMSIRLMGWFCGALEIYFFFLIINIDISIIDVVLIETFTALMRSIVFFIPAGVGIQELSFILIGNFLGLANPVSFSMALGRRIREIMIGLPAIIAWILLFEKKIKFR